MRHLVQEVAHCDVVQSPACEIGTLITRVLVPMDFSDTSRGGA